MTTINPSLLGDEKLRDFLLVLRKEIELDEINAESIKSIGIKYKKLKAIFDDDDEIRKYLRYCEKKELIKLDFVSKQQIRDKKIPDEVYISKITPDHTAIEPADFYAVKRHYKINFYPDDVFIFEYNEHNIQEIGKFFGELKNTDKVKLNLSEFSAENLKKIQKIIKIILDSLELQGINRLTGNRIPLQRFEKEDFSYEEIKSVLNRLDKDIIEVKNDAYTSREKLEKMGKVSLIGGGIIEQFSENELSAIPSEEDLSQYLFLGVWNLDGLKEIKENIDKKLEEKDGKKDEPKESKKIKKITLIEMNDGKHLIAINDNLNETKQIKNSEWWDIFIREVKERGMSNRTNVKDIPKDMVDYFNYNKGKCPIYMGGKYDLTDIFVGRGIDTAINEEVKTKVMTERQYLVRKGRKK